MIGHFNAKSSNWSSIDATTVEGAQLGYVTSSYGMKQAIAEATHVLEFFLNQHNFLISSTILWIQECIQHYIQDITIK